MPRLQRKKLDQISRRLTEMAARVPDQGRRFHARRRRTSEEVRQLADRWWLPWVPRHQLDRIVHEADNLGQLAGPLGDLLHHVPVLDEKIGATVARCRESAADRQELAELVTWIEQRAEDWRIQLLRSGTRSERVNEVELERKRLDDLQKSVDQHREAVELLTEGIDRLTSLPTSAEALAAAPARSALPDLRRRLLDEGPSRGWLDELRTHIEVLKRIPPDPLLESEGLDSLVQGLQTWSELLDSHRQEAKDLVRRIDQPNTTWARLPTAERQEISETAHRLHDLLQGQANETRTRRLGALQSSIEELEKVVGTQAALHRAFETAASLGCGTPTEYERWQEEMRRAEELFRGSVGARRNLLRTTLEENTQELSETIVECRKQPLSASVSDQLSDIEEKLRLRATFDDPQDLPRAIGRVRELAEQVASLDRQVSAERSELARGVAELARSHDELRRQARSLDLEVADLSSSISELEGAVEIRGVDAAQRRLRRLQAQHAQLLQRFEDHALGLVDDHRQAAARTAEALRTFGDELQELPSFSVSEGAEPAELVAAVREAETIRTALVIQVKELGAKLLETCREMAATLARLDRSDALQPADREALSHLSFHLTQILAQESQPTDTAGPPTPDLGRLAELAGTRDRVEQFLDRLREPEERSRRLRDDLQRRLRRLGEESAGPELSEIAQRAGGLISAAPTAPERSRDALSQLGEAERLIVALEQQTRRLAAAEVERDWKTVKAHSGGLAEGDASEDDGVLEKLESWDRTTLPPHALRARLAELARRARSEGTVPERSLP